MHRTILKTILVAIVIAVCALAFSGCKKEHTIDTPYDFHQKISENTGDSENKEDENGSLVDNNTTVPSGSSNGDSNGNSSSGNSNGDTNENSSSGNSNGDSNGGSSSGTSNDGSSNGSASSNNDTSQGNSGVSGSPSDGTGTEDLTFMDVAQDYQVPKDIEYKMTTKALLDTYMSYPFFDTICFEKSPEDTYNQWIDSDISCGKELLSRKDIVSVALNCYQDLLASEPTSHIASDAEVVIELKLDWIELLLHHSTIQNKASQKEKAEIFKLAQLRDSTVEKNGYAITELLPDLAAAYK